MHISHLRTLVLSAVASIGLASTSTATTVTIGFDVPDQIVELGSPYIENGFSFSPASNDDNGTLNGLYVESSLAVDETILISNVDSLSFSLTAFDYGRFVNNSVNVADSFDMLGFLNGVQIVDFGNFTGTTSATFTTDIATLIDELRIVGTGSNNAGPAWDNFVFETDSASVPLPAGLPLLLAGLGGFVLLRRRNRG